MDHASFHVKFYEKENHSFNTFIFNWGYYSLSLLSGKTGNLNFRHKFSGIAPCFS